MTTDAQLLHVHEDMKETCCAFINQVINCRLAMLGAFAGLTAELASGKSIIEQYRCVSLRVALQFRPSAVPVHALFPLLPSEFCLVAPHWFQVACCLAKLPSQTAHTNCTNGCSTRGRFFCRIAPGPIAGVFLLFAVASLIPIAKGVPRKGAAEFGSPLTFMTPNLEVNVGASVSFILCCCLLSSTSAMAAITLAVFCNSNPLVVRACRSHCHAGHRRHHPHGDDHWPRCAVELVESV